MIFDSLHLLVVGDVMLTVIAVLAACIGNGLSWEQAAETANVAAGIVVGKSGTAPVLRDELAAALAGRAVPVM
jgi:D-beta-D-heptose 7-phosphate kinase/D-beta-D-heptose 1-phosphate adenosyltransferase